MGRATDAHGTRGGRCFGVEMRGALNNPGTKRKVENRKKFLFIIFQKLFIDEQNWN